MEPEHWRFGGGADSTVLHPLVLVALLTACAVMLFLPRKHAAIVLLSMAFLVPGGQQIRMGGLHFFVVRIVIVVGLMRWLFSRAEQSQRRWSSLDTVFTLWVLCRAVAFMLLFMDRGAVVYQLGEIWDYLGGYLVFRYAIQDEEDVRRTINAYALIAFVLAGCMTYEQLTGRNAFAFLGGVSPFSEVRGGRVRSQAIFGHAILAGTFGAAILPLFLWQWKDSRRFRAAIGAFSSTVMVIASACSTPLLGYISAIVAVCAWPFRGFTRMARWGSLAALGALSLMMNAPVWFLVAHVGVVEGSSANHRADLIDTFLRHFDEWWLLGTKSNASWGFLMFDTSNQYVHEGITGGLAALVLFVAVISLAFGRSGRARKVIEETDRKREWLLWLLGSSLFAVSVAMFGISFFDQTKFFFFSLLAMISAVSAPILTGRRQLEVGDTSQQIRRPIPSPGATPIPVPATAGTLARPSATATVAPRRVRATSTLASIGTTARLTKVSAAGDFLSFPRPPRSTNDL